MHAEWHPDQRAWATGELVLLGEQLDVLDFVRVQEALAKRAGVSPADGLCQKQPEMTSASAPLQVGRNVLLGKRTGQTTQALPLTGVIRVQDDEPSATLLVEQVGAKRHLAPQVGSQMTRVQGLVHTGVAAIGELSRVQIPALDELLRKH